MTTEDELSKLAQNKLAPDSQIWVAHFFSHFGATTPELRAFQHAMASAGFGEGGELGVTDERSGDGYWHHYIYTRISADPELCRRMDASAREVAADHVVRYDFWEVIRHVETGRPRDMTGHWTPRRA